MHFLGFLGGYDYVKSAQESLKTTGGDCDDASVLAANLLQAVGIRTRFVFIPGHVYIQAYLPDALKRYKTEDNDFVSLDLTCRSCSIGELPYSDFEAEKKIGG
jgi:transglutaminase-like putative cysteine protease